MFSFIEFVISFILFLELRVIYLLVLMNKRASIVFPISVEGWIKGMLIECGRAEGDIHLSRKISRIMNCFK